jgi:hypothetical protein
LRSQQRLQIDVLLKGIGRAFVTADWPSDAFEATLVAHLS